jgi:hypothetical protein
MPEKTCRLSQHHRMMTRSHRTAAVPFFLPLPNIHYLSIDLIRQYLGGILVYHETSVDMTLANNRMSRSLTE